MPSQLLSELLTHPAITNVSSNPKMRFPMRMCVLNATTTIDRTRKILDNTRIARGRPCVGGMILVVASTEAAVADIVLDTRESLTVVENRSFLS
jgi:hypothetical protein